MDTLIAPEPPYYIASTDQDGRPVVVEDGQRVVARAATLTEAEARAADLNQAWDAWQDARFAEEA